MQSPAHLPRPASAVSRPPGSVLGEEEAAGTPNVLSNGPELHDSGLTENLSTHDNICRNLFGQNRDKMPVNLAA